MIDIFSRQAIGNGVHAAPGAAASHEYPALSRARSLSREQIADLVEDSGLAGKGGAGFPTHTKLRLMQRGAVDSRHLVINGSEHEPGSLKDLYLLERYSATVLEGVLILAYAAGVGSVRVAVVETADKAIASLTQGIASLIASGQLDHGGSTLSIDVVPVPESYIVGEETALLEFIEGRKPWPRERPPFPIQSGLFGAPTLVQNVETVAHLPYIVSHGADAYRSLGRNGAGATLCTFGDEFARSGVQLLPLGITLQEVVFVHGGGLRSGERVKAVQPGGPSAAYLTADQFDVVFDAASLAQAGSSLGCAAIRAFAEATDMVAVVSEVANFFARESCGQCPQCRMQTQMLAGILKQTSTGRGNQKLLNQIPTIVKLNVDKGICGLIRMPVAPVYSALKLFEREFEARMPVTS